MTILAGIYGFFWIRSGFCQSDHIPSRFCKSCPIRSGFWQSDPIRSDPAFVNARSCYDRPYWTLVPVLSLKNVYLARILPLLEQLRKNEHGDPLFYYKYLKNKLPSLIYPNFKNFWLFDYEIFSWNHHYAPFLHVPMEAYSYSISPIILLLLFFSAQFRRFTVTLLCH